MKKGTKVLYTSPRGATREGKVVATHTNHTGVWLEIQPLERGAATFRARPLACTPL